MSASSDSKNKKNNKTGNPKMSKDENPPGPKRLYKVFVSSTCLDNQERRRIVQEAITTAGMVWYGMEIFTASTRPTKEECLRYVREADLFIGIIAWRYGWEPPDGEKSITEMEYDAANEAGIGRLMFQLDPDLPVNPGKDYDQGPDRWKKQEKLDAFKARFSKDQLPAYFNEANLSGKVLHALNKWREEREQNKIKEQKKQREQETGKKAQSLKEGTANFPEPDWDEEIRSYCKKAESLHEGLPVAGFATYINVPIDIEDIYVPLRAMIDLRGVSEGVYYGSAHAEECLRRCDEALEIPLAEAFSQAEKRRQKGLIILGDPGSGKTTHLKRILLYCLRNGPETIGLPAGMLPVFLPLRELSRLDKGLDAFIEAQLTSPHLKTHKGFGEHLLKRGNLLFLLDGLDEVSDLSHREKVAQWIVQALKYHETCRFVVTCRFAGYSPTVRLSERFLEMHIRPFSEEQAERFVRNWYNIVEGTLAKDPEQAKGIAAEKANELISRLKEPDFRARRVFELTRNPLLLANICLIHRHRGGLPNKRARLYEECIDVLLEHWREAKKLKAGVSAQDGRRALQPAALWLHSREGRTRATASELAPYIEPVLKSVSWKGGSAEDFLRTIRDESGLLTGWDQKNYGFMHLGFQEYLAAREIRARAFKDPAVLSELAAHFGESWWQEVGLLLLAMEEPSLFVPYMREVVKQETFVKYSNLVEACLDDAAEISLQPFLDLLKAPQEKETGLWERLLVALKVSVKKDTRLWERQLIALKVLDRLDKEAVKGLKTLLATHPSPAIRAWIEDRRKQLVQDMITAERGDYGLVRIPGGVFLMGSPHSDEGRWDNEGPLHQVHMSDFYMGRSPVTNEEYALFLEDNPSTPEPKYWADRRFNQPRQPVVGVSWNDAKRYAEWAGLRLPTEAEWEYACRAGTSTRYYTGDKEEDLDKAGWYYGNSKGQLHPVGEKVPNTFGLYDMHGNVWEWVEDDWHINYNGAPTDGSSWVGNPREAGRVIRGGGWFSVAQVCRSAFRDCYEPGDRGSFLGFRLSRSV